MNLRPFDKILLSLSGGKDSQAMLTMVHGLATTQAVGDRLTAIHIDTGGEWPESLPHCEALTAAFAVPLTIIHPNRPIPQEVAKRGKWPAAACRFCTANCKRDAYEKFIRSLPQSKLLHITGERKEESRHRAYLPELATEERIHTRLRHVTRWRPMLPFTEQDIWAIINGSGLPHHAAYDYGCARVSCALCVLAPEHDLRIGAEHNPERAESYLKLERDMNHNFTVRKRLSSILA